MEQSPHTPHNFMFCSGCGTKIHADASACPKCGKPNAVSIEKNQIVAGILAILLGNIGVHKFYLGRIGMGFLYLLFCWTLVPAIIGVIEGIIYLTATPQRWKQISSQ